MGWRMGWAEDGWAEAEDGLRVCGDDDGQG